MSEGTMLTDQANFHVRVKIANIDTRTEEQEYWKQNDYIQKRVQETFDKLTEELKEMAPRFVTDWNWV